jgi:tetratricopeptide (TPR) repeat protein
VNTSTAPVTNFKELVPDSRFVLQPPLNNRFLSSSAIAVTRLKNGIEIEVTPRSSEEIGTDDVLGGMIARTRRDVERYPRSARSRTNLGLALLNGGDARAAMQEFEAALEYEPGNYVAAVNLARAKLDSGDIDGAGLLYQSILNDFPNDVSSLMSLAFIRVRRGDFKSAAELFEDAVRQNEKAPLPRYHLAMVLLRLGKANDAIAQLRIAARTDVRSPQLYHALGVAYTIAGQLKRAAKAFKTALTLAPSMVDAAHGLALVLLQEGKSQDAIALLEQQVDRTPEDHPGREMLARAYAHVGQYERARSQLKQISQRIETNTEQNRAERARLANNIGTCFAWEGNRGEARKWLKLSTDLDPDNALPYVNLARLLLSEDSLADAVTLLEKCKDRFSDDEPSRMLLAISYERLGDYDRAIAQMRQLVERGEKSPPWAFAYLGGLLTERRNDFPAAQKVFEEGLQKYPSNSALVNNYAYAQLAAGHVEAARALLGSLAKGGELYPELMATFGLLRLWEGDLQQGRSLYQQAAKLASSLGNQALARAVRQKMHLELARAYLRHRDTHSAIQEIRGGLLLKEGRADYRRDLQALLDDLRGEQPSLFPSRN